MMKLYPSLLAATLFTMSAAGTICACAGASSPGSVATSNGKAISTVEITPNKETLSKGATFQFEASAKFADGSTQDVTRDDSTVWNTSSADVATVSKTGLVTANKVGLVEITATYKGVKGVERFAVTP